MRTLISYTLLSHFIQYFSRNWPWYSLRGLHIRITWFSLYGIRIPLFSLYGIHMPLLPYMVIQPIVLGMVLLWVAMDSSLSQGSLLWRHNDMTVIVSRNTRGRASERDTQQRVDNRRSARRPLTSLGTSAWPYRVTTQYSYYINFAWYPMKLRSYLASSVFQFLSSKYDAFHLN